jgi:hypothetical protein
MELLQKFTRLTLPLMTIALLLLAGCETGAQKDRGTSPQLNPCDQHERMDFLNDYVTEREVYCAEEEFKKIVGHGTTTNPDPIVTPAITFSVESFRELKADFMPSCNDTSGLVIHYGFDITGKTLSLAFSAVCIDLKDDVGEYAIPETPLYVLDSNSKFIPAPQGSLTAWRAGPGKAFQEQVVVDKYDHKRFQLIYADKFAHMVYTFGQVDSLIIDNQLIASDYVEVVPVAEPERWSTMDRGADFSMKTCLVAVDRTGRRLKNTPHAPGEGKFKDRGSDLGSACPPLCDGWALFAKRGTDVRKNCKDQ